MSIHMIAADRQPIITNGQFARDAMYLTSNVSCSGSFRLPSQIGYSGRDVQRVDVIGQAWRSSSLSALHTTLIL